MPAARDSKVQYKSSDFLYIFDKILTANSSMPSDDTNTVDITLNELEWVLRLYAGLFRNEYNRYRTLLKNLLTIPIHLSVIA